VVANDLNRQIATHNMKIPIRRVGVNTFTISTGLRSKIEDHLFQGQLPKRLIIGMVVNSDMNGDPKTNPFSFKHFNPSKSDVSVNEKSIHNKPFESDFDHEHYLPSYRSLYTPRWLLD